MKQRVYDRMAAGVSLVLLATLAAGTWYLAEIASRHAAGNAAPKISHEPDYFVERFALTRLNARGDPVFKMSAERLDHFPDDDSTTFVHPLLVSLDPGNPLVTLRADRGMSTTQGLETHLYDNVLLTRAATGGATANPELRIESDYMLLLSEEDVARSDRPVRITYGDSVLTGVGMEFNNGSRRLEVKSQVRGRWVAPPDKNG
jgi:lipopolysaccharide export system protein LptC